MNWFQKTAQLLSANFELNTPTVGLVSVEVQCSFEDYDRWYKYKHGPQGWNDSHLVGEEARNEAMNRAIAMEPDVRLHISHDYSGFMPRIDRPKRTFEEKNEMDAFDIIGDQMTNLNNDDFYETVKIKDVGETIRSWMFMPRQGKRRVNHKDLPHPGAEFDVQYELKNHIIGILEELQQRYWRIAP